MKKILVLVGALALIATLLPAKGEARTLRQRVTRLEAKMNCLRRYPLVEFSDYAGYVNTTVDNGALTWDDTAGSGNPDELQDAGFLPGLDFGYGQGVPADVWALGISNTKSCRAKFRALPSPFPRPAARLMHTRQLARIK